MPPVSWTAHFIFIVTDKSGNAVVSDIVVILGVNYFGVCKHLIYFGVEAVVYILLSYLVEVFFNIAVLLNPCYDVIAVVGFNNTACLADLKGKGGFLKLRNHLTVGEQIAVGVSCMPGSSPTACATS